MRENFRKIKCMLVVLAMLLSVLTVSMFVFENPIIKVARGDTHYVNSPLNPGDVANNTKISEAMFNASDGDTIVLCDGTYYENVVINRSITLKSENGSGNCVIQSPDGIAINISNLVGGGTRRRTTGALGINGQTIVIDGIDIRTNATGPVISVPYNESGGSGYATPKHIIAQNITIKRCNISTNGTSTKALNISIAKTLTVRDNIFWINGSDEGITTCPTDALTLNINNQSHDVNISANTFKVCWGEPGAVAINASNLVSSAIYGNNFSGTDVHLWVTDQDTPSLTVYHNNFSNNGTGSQDGASFVINATNTSQGGRISSMLFKYNHFNDDSDGFRVQTTTTRTLNGTNWHSKSNSINYNNFNDTSDFGILFNLTNATLDALYNWYGNKNGSNATGYGPANISNPRNITYRPWLTSPYRRFQNPPMAIAIPGRNIWQGSNSTLDTKYPLSVDTKDMYYGQTVDITLNHSSDIAAKWPTTDGDIYYLFHPRYQGRQPSTLKAYKMNWSIYNSTEFVKPYSADWTFENVELNCSGLWVIDGITGGSTNANFSNYTQMDTTVLAWFWVNASPEYTINDPDDFAYNSTGTFTLSVSGGEAATLDIRFDQNGTSVQDSNRYESDGSRTYEMNNSYRGEPGENAMFSAAGNYTCYAYYDCDNAYPQGDNDDHYYQENNMDNTGFGYSHYNETYGSNSTAVGSASWVIGSGWTADWNWTYCGPWDPPEKNASRQQLVVTAGVPTLQIPTANQTMYWGFPGEVNITVTEPNGVNLSEGVTTRVKAYVANDNGTNISRFLTIDNSTAPNGYIQINSTAWANSTGMGATQKWGENGTWTVYVLEDINSDGINEWNASVTFEVRSSVGVLQFTWIDDDGTLGNTSIGDTDGVIPAVPGKSNQPVTLKFTIENSTHAFLGGQTLAEDKKNITISGDLLYCDGGSLALDKFPAGSVWFDGTSEWWVNVTPVMNTNGGEIRVAVDWGANGALSGDENKLTIGGTWINGSIVTISPTEFAYDENLTVSVTVTGPTGTAISNAHVQLYWLRTNGQLGDMINSTIAPDTTGGNVYSFWFNKSQQKANQTVSGNSMGWTTIKAPRNITAYVDVTNIGFGYALAKMNAVNDLKIDCNISEVMAGKKQPKVWFNTTVIDKDTGNLTGYPEDTGLKVRLYNETGIDVTHNIIMPYGATPLDGDDNKSKTNIYFMKPGTYTIHAYNNTHRSWGDDNNDTLIVTPVDVTSSLAEIIWGVDKNVSTTFTVTYKGVNQNGTLRIDNMTKIGSAYNKTWTNCSFNNKTGADTGGNTSKYVTITDGVYTVYNITANNLTEWRSAKNNHYSQQNISFYFKPKGENYWAVVNGKLPVKIPDVTPSPASIPYNEPAELELTVTGRGTGLIDVFVSIDVPGLSGEMNSTTDADGKVTFAFTPPSTGNVIIRIENRTSSVKVKVTSWKLYLDAPASVNEGESFTVTVRNNSVTGDGLPDAAVLFAGETKTTDSSGQATFTAPSVSANIEYTMTATLEGYAEDSAAITIISKPQLVIVAPEKATAGQTFKVTIADDLGNAIIGATVTINNKDYTSGSQGLATLTAPKKGTYDITATKTGFTAATAVSIKIEEAGIPGFELLTLIAALGVAFILLRRRRH